MAATIARTMAFIKKKPRAISGSENRAKAEGTRRKFEVLNLQPGEIAEVRSEEEIAETLDENGKNGGLWFMPEMRRYYGQRFKVYKRVERIIMEATGEYRRMKNTVLLEGVICDGSEHHGCDRSCFHYWRESWLKRVE